jgi:hypothetical protein
MAKVHIYQLFLWGGQNHLTKNDFKVKLGLLDVGTGWGVSNPKPAIFRVFAK